MEYLSSLWGSQDQSSSRAQKEHLGDNMIYDTLLDAPPVTHTDFPTGQTRFDSSHSSLTGKSIDVPVPSVRDLTGQVQLLDKYPKYEGSYSNVFLGRFNSSQVAVKVLREVGQSRETTERKLKREREVWSLLDHQHILPFYGCCGKLGKYGALISPWYKNGNAREYIEKNPLKVSERFILWCGMVEGVAYLHHHNPPLVHGDIKPTNVLIDNEGYARICDFGLIKVLANRPTGWTTTTSHTGTLRYLAYELFNDEGHITVTTEGDIYALGCLALEVIFLQSPYAKLNHASRIYRSIEKRVPPAASLPVDGASSETVDKFWQLLQKCWDGNPDARPDASDLHGYISNNRDDLKVALDEVQLLPPELR